METSRTGPDFDLQPDPRILPMLGEINLLQWRCLAELVDNSVDSFLAAKRGGRAIATPEAHISIPTSEAPSVKISVRDNGPGMDPSTLERAVRAGWTGNDPISSLGMFGMGFNIATARLGTLTRVWTTREGDSEWYGLDVDFEALMRQRHFRTPRLTRPKIDPNEHGTEVTVERLKAEQRQWIARAANRSKLGKDLGLAYSAMLRHNGTPIAFRLTLNGTLVQGKDHCIWGGDGNPSREVQTSRFGVVNAYQSMDVRLPDRPFCTRCWQWLPSGEQNCPSCGTADAVSVRQRRVHGWLGIQRYLSVAEYGIDFLRHGRKIEIANKDLFSWNNGETLEPEYPIDDPRNRGRIVGEIHLDHCRVMYTKDRFDRNDPAWDEMVRIVRGEGPLRPDKAAELGIGQNISPLFLLFQAFRRSSPKPKVAGSYAKLLIVPDNDTAEQMGKRFYAGEGEYQTDGKWWELVQEADRLLLVPTGATTAPAGFLGGGGQTGGQTTPVTIITPPVQPPQRTPIPSLSQEYRDDHTQLRWDVKAYEVESSDPELGADSKPWTLKATAAGIQEFFVNPRHPMFYSATMTTLDGLLAELAWRAMDFTRGNPSNATFATILAGLRGEYAGISKLDPTELSNDAELVLNNVARSLSKHLTTDDSRALFAELSPAEQEAAQKRMAIRSVRNPQQLIDGGRFLEYAPRITLLSFFRRHPELFLDGRCWDVAFSTLDYGSQAATEAAQAQVVHYYSSLLADAIWLAEQDPGDLADASRARLLRGAMALDLLAEGAWEEA